MVAVDIIRAIFTPAWRLFTETPVPGLSSDLLFVSFADLLIALILIRIGLGLLSSDFGVGRLASLYRSSNTKKNPKISPERKGDQY